MTLRRIPLIALLALAAMPASEGAQTPTAQEIALEFPWFDHELAHFVQAGLNLKADRRTIATGTRADRLAALLRLRRVGDADRLVAEVVATPNDDVLPVLEVVVQSAGSFFHRDEPGVPLRQLVAPARQHLSAYSRERAAEIALRLTRIGTRDSGSETEPARIAAFQRFAAEYAGTSAALFAELDALLVTRTETLQRIRVLEEFIERHPGTAAAAQALFYKGSELETNIPVTLAEPRGTDPTPRFLAVLDIVRDLEGDRYPRGPWTTKAPELVIGFYASDHDEQIRWAPGNLDRMIESYYQFVKARFDRSTPIVPMDGLG
jgi:hypothetical protein